MGEGLGQEYTLSSGQKVHLVGLPQKTQTSPVDGGEWAEFNVDKWRSAMFTAKSFFTELFVDTTDFIGNLCDKCGGKDEALLIEVGCGTGEALIPLFDRAKYTVGMDFNPHFINFCKENVPERNQHHVRHLLGDAQELDALLESELPKEWLYGPNGPRPKIVICVGNTIGIMPDEIKQNVYQMMMKVAGREGFFVVVYWNGNKFGHAVQNFYGKNPQLCGPFSGECIDLQTCTLTTPSGYRTHWTKPEEARDIFENQIGAEVYDLQEKGHGVLAAGRQKA